MIVRPMPHGDFLLPDLPPELAVHRHANTGRGVGTLLLEDAPHVVQELGGADSRND